MSSLLITNWLKPDDVADYYRTNPPTNYGDLERFVATVLVGGSGDHRDPPVIRDDGGGGGGGGGLISGTINPPPDWNGGYIVTGYYAKALLHMNQMEDGGNGPLDETGRDWSVCCAT
jgi:hypothetical protein